jgi:hypothetical protein
MPLATTPVPTRIWLERAALIGVPLALCGWRFTSIFQRMSNSGDFPAHERFAQEIAQTGQVTIPHFLYELSLIAVHALRPAGSWRTATMVVSMATVLATTLLLIRWITSLVPESNFPLRLAAVMVLPMALLTVQPVLPLGPLVRDPWFVAAFPANQYHNPTTLLSRPFTLALFGFGVSAAFGPWRRWRAIAGCAALVLVAGLIKPSFLMAFLPAVGLLAVVNWKRADWKLLLFGLGIPTALLLAGQFALRYWIRADDGVGIVYAPLLVLGLYGPTDLVTLGTRLVASVLFPLAVTIVFVPQALRDRSVVVSWLAFAVGISWGYLFAETGGKTSAGDFLWSGQLTAFLLFAVTAMFLLKQFVSSPPSSNRTWLYGRVALCFLVLGWHVVSGVRHLQLSWFD